MSGKRCKALRREFIQKHGRAPRRAVTETNLRTGRWLGKPLSWFQMSVNVASEWRRVKRAYLQRRAA